MGELYKSSFYNRFYEVGGRYWIFNTLNQGLLEVPEQSFRLLQNNKFDIEKCDQDMVEDINELIENEFVVFENYNELKTIKNLFHNDKYKRDYMSVTIIPTLECNCVCFYCFERQHHIKQEDSFDWNKVTEGILHYIEEKLPYVKTLNIAWFGGEPLLKIKEIDDLSEKLIALTEKYGVDYTASMTTNGTRLKYIPDVCNRLKKNKISNIQITLDGDREHHDQTRKYASDGQGTFEDVVKAIKILYLEKFNVSVRINLNKKNIYTISNVFDVLEYEDLKKVKLYFGQLLDYSSGNTSEIYMNIEEFSDTIVKLYEVLKDRGFPYGMDDHYPTAARACMACRPDSAVIDCNGNIFKCRTQTGELDKKIGNVLNLENQTRKEAIQEINWAEWSPFEYSKCTECQFLPLCMCGCPYTLYDNNSTEPICVEWKYITDYFVVEKIKEAIINEQD